MSSDFLGGDEYLALVSRMTKRMFRLETFDDYPDDYALKARWESGEEISEYFLSYPWMRNVKAKTAAGVRCQRVHIVPEPLTEYLRFEIEVCYPLNQSCGEEVYLLPRSRIREPLRFADAMQDFLLVDDELLLHWYHPETKLWQGTRIVRDPELLKAAENEAATLLELATRLR